MNPIASPVQSLLDSYRNRSRKPEEEIRERIAHVERRNQALFAIREVCGDSALERARALETSHDASEEMPLFGIPVVIKDNVAEAGKPLRAGRKQLAGAPAKSSATLVERLERAGAVIVARANMDELAYGVTGSNPHTGQVRNPVDEKRHPGGSSAGSGAAVADGMVPLAVGTDTAGSVRIPASLCGVVGMRPTHGLVPSDGIAPLSPSLDTAGPIARTVHDAALLLSVLADRPDLVLRGDPRPTVKTCRVIALDGAFAVEVDRGIRGLFEDACATFWTLALSVQRASVEALAAGPRASGPIIGSEAAFAWQAEFDAHPDWFGEEVAGHLTKGAAIKAVRYLRAREESAVVVRAIDALFERADLVVLPTTAIVATPAGAPGPQLPFLALTVPFSLGGCPAITVPMGKTEGLPAGLQIVGRRGNDALVLAAAAAFESARS